MPLSDSIFRAPVLAALAAFSCASASAAGLEHYITARGDKLYDGDQEFRWVSVNMPDSLQIISHYEFDGDFDPTRYRWPDAYEVRDCVRTVKALGGRVFRGFVITCSNDPSPKYAFNVSHNPVVGNEQALREMDRLLQVCNEEGIRVFIPLVAYHSGVRGDWHTYGEDFWNVGSEANLKFKNMISQLVNRTNTLTGVRYKDDPAILGWQTGNEMVIGDDAARRAWVHDIAAYIKKVDPHHLLIDGRNPAADVYQKYDEYFDDPNIDVLSYHTYRPLKGRDSVETEKVMRAYTKGKVALLVSEVAMFTPVPELHRLLDLILQDGAVGCNFWAVRFHNRDGGFYKHADHDSQFEDLNWPGFPNPGNYLPEIDTERQILDLLHTYAWKIRGEAMPAMQAPLPPQVLQFPDPAHISWRGSTSAVSYAIERATQPGGPWQTVEAHYYDNLVCYAPLYCDTTAEPGKDYYYRFTAQNDAGTSVPSTIVGPVRTDRRWIIDELFDTSQLDSTSQNVRIQKSYGQDKYLEDLAVAVRDDASKPATLVYALPGGLQHFTLRVYDAQVSPKFYLLAADGSRTEIAPQVTPYDGGSRKRFTATLEFPAAAKLAIEIPAGAAPTEGIGRVEIACQPTAQ